MLPTEPVASVRIIDLPDAQWRECEAILHRFAESWTPAQSTRFDEWLIIPECRIGLLMELVLTDFELRWRAGCPRSIDAYLADFPELTIYQAELEASERRFADRSTEEVVMGRYVLQQEVGRGAFGVVWRAWDQRLRRTVAIKRSLPGRASDPAVQARLIREAHLAGQLHHPGIVMIYDTHESGDHIDLVMEFVDGETLAQRLQRGPMLPLDCAPLVMMLADAVAFAHERGLIHRDIKPSNILLGADMPKLSDFGLARGNDVDVLTLTAEGQIFGTPAYMAPETLHAAHTANTLSDVYSLGVVLYQCLTGEVPFRGQWRMLMRQIVEDEPIPPRRYSDWIPRDLETICLKALAKEPARRYSSARSFADDLRRFLAHQPIEARPTGRGYRLWRTIQRRPWTTAMLATLILSITIGVVGIYLQWRRAEFFLAESQNRLAEVTKLQQRSDGMLRHVYDAVSDFLRATFDDPALLGPEYNQMRLRFIDTALEHYHEMLAAEPDDPTLWLQLAEAYEMQAMQQHIATSSPENVLRGFEAANRYRERLVAHRPQSIPHQLRLAHTQYNIAMLALEAGQPDRAALAFRRGEEILAPLRAYCRGEDTPFDADGEAISGIGSAWLNERGTFAGWKDSMPLSVWYYSGLIAAHQGHWQAADDHWQHALQWYDGLIYAKPSLVHAFDAMHQRAAILAWRATAALKRDDLPAAQRYLHEAVAHYERSGEQPLTHLQRLAMLEVLPRLQDAYEDFGDRVTAIRLGQRILAEWTRLAEQFPNTSTYQRMRGVCLHELGNLFDDIGDVSACETAFREALAIRQRLREHMPDQTQLHVDLSATTFNFARWLESQRRTREVEALYQLAIIEMEAALRVEPNNALWQRYLRDRITALARFRCQDCESLPASGTR